GTFLGSGLTLSTAALASGQHTIYFAVTDTHGVTATTSIGVFVNRLATPSFGITPTTFGTQYATNSLGIGVYLVSTDSYNLTFTATSTDFEGGVIPTASYAWYDVTSGEPGTFIASGTTLNRNFGSGINPSPGQYVYRIKVWDSLGTLASAATTFQVWGIRSYLGPGTGNGQLAGATGIDSNGATSFYLADSSNSRYQKLDSSFLYSTQYPGGLPASFSSTISDIKYSASKIWVLDSASSTITILNDAVPPTFVATWGGLGTGNGSFTQPAGIETDGTYAYISDAGNNRVQRFSNILATWTFDTQLTGLASPTGIAFAGTTLFFVAERAGSGGVIKKYDTTFNLQGAWAVGGLASFSFGQNMALAADSSGRVFVADVNNSKIHVLDTTGSLAVSFGGAGSGIGKFQNPAGINNSDATNKIIQISDTLNNRIIEIKPGSTCGW
ncbi:hypothetical protein HYY75_07870, partial [bacterium]|nr:hypothetical protein [bacterium]